MFKLALMLILTTIVVTQASTQFDAVPGNTPVLYNKLAGAHISYEGYSKIYHVDLTEYYQLRDTINATINLANETCAEMAQRDICTITIMQLQTQLAQAIRDDENMDTMRQERGFCDWCGRIQGAMYGTLDDTKGKLIVNAINENRNETQTLHDIILNQTTIFHTSLKTNEKNMERIQNGMDKITKYLNETRERIVTDESYLKAWSRTQSLTQIVSTGIQHLTPSKEGIKHPNEEWAHILPMRKW